MAAIVIQELAGVWSATPTPFDRALRVDEPSVQRLVEHHVQLGIKGLFLAGTCGEGAWMKEQEKRRLVRATVAAARGRLPVAVQVSDNSAARILDNIERAAEDGADLAVIAPPYFLMNATPANVERLYAAAIRRSPLPIGIYDRGRHSSVPVPNAVLKTIYAAPNVIAVKDSSLDPARRKIALAARRRRPRLRLLSGSEFDCVDYLQAGYDGLLLGGAIFNGDLAGRIMDAVARGDGPRAQRLQQRMNRLLYAVYGGRKLRCWLTGLKHLLVEMNVFGTRNSFLNYPLTPCCRKAIARLLAQDRDVLFPWEERSRR
jgi:4-hydroxy-tetrahydrodipicolinate synthase